jgi:flagellar export protein FliJ
MKPFHYRLQFLHHLREKAKDNAQESYANAMQDRISQEKICDTISNHITKIATKIQENVQQGMSAPMMASFYASMANAKQLLRESQELVADKEKIEERQRQEYLARKSDFDALDKHKDRKKGEHLFHEFKEEEKMLEEIANNRSSFHSPLIHS